MNRAELSDRHPDGEEALRLVQRMEREGLGWQVLLDALIVHIQDQPNAPVWLASQLERIVDQMEVDQT